jgi:hypothetical protein
VPDPQCLKSRDENAQGAVDAGRHTVERTDRLPGCVPHANEHAPALRRRAPLDDLWDLDGVGCDDPRQELHANFVADLLFGGRLETPVGVGNEKLGDGVYGVYRPPTDQHSVRVAPVVAQFDGGRKCRGASDVFVLHFFLYFFPHPCDPRGQWNCLQRVELLELLELFLWRSNRDCPSGRYHSQATPKKKGQPYFT